MDLRAERRVIRRLGIGSDRSTLVVSPRFPAPLLFFLLFLPFISHGNISWKSRGNNPLSLPPVIYRPPLSRNVADRISPFNLPAFIPRYRACVYTPRVSRFHSRRNFHRGNARLCRGKEKKKDYAVGIACALSLSLEKSEKRQVFEKTKKLETRERERDVEGIEKQR